MPFISLETTLKLSFMGIHVTKGYLFSEVQSIKCEKCIFSIYFFNMNISFNMSTTFIKIYLLDIETIMEGTVSQIFDLGPSFYFMQCGKLDMKKLQKVTRFLR